jgi:hypothetical protein
VTPSYYRTRVQTVEAHQVTAIDHTHCRALADWCGGDVVDRFGLGEDLAEPAIIYVADDNQHPEMGSYAENGDWIVRYQSGEFCVYSNESFRANFDPVVRLT